jgi:hypothetical protein
VKRYITLRYTHHTAAARAMVRGKLALHRSDSDVLRWEVTHVPTGCRIARFARCDSARRALRELNETGDWNFTRHDVMLPYADRVRAILRAARADESPVLPPVHAVIAVDLVRREA